MKIGFESIAHQGWFTAQQHKDHPMDLCPYPIHAKSGEPSSARREFMLGVHAFQDGRSWKTVNV